MKYINMAKKVEYSPVCEPLYSYKDLPETEEEWDALKDSQAVNKVSAEVGDDLFAIAKGQTKEFTDLSGHIVDIVVKLPIGDGKFKLVVQPGVEVVSLVSAPGIVFKNKATGEAINVYKGVVKMFSMED